MSELIIGTLEDDVFELDGSSSLSLEIHGSSGLDTVVFDQELREYLLTTLAGC